MEPTRAAGAMILRSEASIAKLLAAAAVAHASVSLFWAAVLWRALPVRRVVPWAVLAAAGIAVIDLRLIAPVFFPEVAALAFWPQFADHLAWGTCVGATLAYRRFRAAAGAF